MKINVLKWIYNLGYERATDRYYYNLMQRIDNLHTTKSPWELDDLIGLDSASRNMSKDEREQRDAFRQKQIRHYQNELRSIVQDVFHPFKEVRMPETIDKFGPEIKS